MFGVLRTNDGYMIRVQRAWTFALLVVPGFNFAWLGNPTSALITVAFIDVWKWSGIVTMVYIAGLNAIPSDLIKAAKIDGANTWQRFWRVRAIVNNSSVGGIRGGAQLSAYHATKHGVLGLTSSAGKAEHAHGWQDDG